MTSPAPIRMLVVERSDAAATTLVTIIAHRFGPRARIEYRTSAAAALTFIQSAGADVALINTTLPDGDGLALCRALRGLPQFADLPIMLLSDGAPPSEKIAGFMSGADDFIVRPIEDRLLAARIEMLWRIKHMGHLPP